MNRILVIIYLISFLISGPVVNATQGLAEITVRTELEGLLNRSFAKENFLIQVSGIYRTEKDKKLIESEVVQRRESFERTTPPPELPGFDVNTKSSDEPTPSEYKTEHFAYSEKNQLIKLNVHVYYNEALDADTIMKLKESVLAYLSDQIDTKYGISFTPFIPRKTEIAVQEIAWERYALIAAIALLLLLALLWVLMRIVSRKDVKDSPPTPVYSEQKIASVSGSGEKTSTADTIIRKALFEQFLANAEAFRVYIDNLPLDKQQALLKHLEGSAFESLLKTLDSHLLEKLKREGNEIKEKHDLAFFSRDFSEFLKAFFWQRSLFFGFLPQCSLEALIALFRESEPLETAVVVRFLPAQRISDVLSALSGPKRRELIKYLSIAADLPFDEISKIEASVREKLRATPNIGSRLTKSEIDFLSDIVMNSEDQDKILSDIRAVAPNSYDRLSQLRFSLDEIPNLPTDIVKKVLGDLDNYELALALVKLDDSLVDFMLKLIPENRQALLISQMATLANASDQEIKKARALLAALFRKVIK